jgi:putative ABC transport system permease protein
MLKDLKFALRSFRNNPAFTAIAVLTLALGIGANTAIFSVVNAVVFHPVPLPHPEQLVQVSSHASSDIGLMSWPDFADVRNQVSSFQTLAAYRPDQFTVTDAGHTELLEGVSGTSNLFAVLGIQPAIGRAFAPNEDETGQNHVVVVTDQFRRRWLGDDLNVIGRSITIDGESYTITGVAPPSLRFPPGLRNAGLFALLPHGRGDSEIREKRGVYNLSVLGRLKPGVTVERAQAELSTIQARLAASYPQTNAGRTITATKLEELLVGKQRAAMLLLLGAVAFVLLIACANVGNLLLARATARQREIAIRAAIGAPASRIGRQLLTESTLLGVIGGGLGLALAFWSLDTLTAIVPTDLPRLVEFSIDWRVLVFTAAVSIGAGLLFGLVPALRAARLDLNTVLNGTGRAVSGGHAIARSLLLIGEIAVAMVLLIGAGLTLRSFSRLSSVDPGFNSHDVLTASFALPNTRYTNNSLIFAFYRELEARLHTIPGVESVALSVTLPLTNKNFFLPFTIEGRPTPSDTDWPTANIRWVSPDYFKVMGIRVVRGRAFTTQDDAPNARPTTIINESTARKYWPNEDPIGKHVTVGDREMELVTYEIIGIVADVRFESLGTRTKPEMYTPFTLTPFPQFPGAFPLAAMVRGAHAETLSGPLRAAVQATDSSLSVTAVKTMDEYLAASLSQQHWTTVLLGVFSGLALALAVVGIYGVMSYIVTQRTRELGIRMALGAQHRDVLRMILFQGLKFSIIGIAIGTCGALAVTRMLEHQLYGISTTDPSTFVAVAFLLTAVALLASFLPARRATRVDPAIAMGEGLILTRSHLGLRERMPTTLAGS